MLKILEANVGSQAMRYVAFQKTTLLSINTFWLDEKKDTKIIPTYEAHDKTSRLLVHTLTKWGQDESLIGIVGREHMEAEKWGHGENNIAEILNS